MASRNKGRKTSSWKKRLLLHPCRNVIKVKETWGNKSFELWYSFLWSWWKETMKGQTIVILLPEVSHSSCCQCPSVVYLAKAGLHQLRLQQEWIKQSRGCIPAFHCPEMLPASKPALTPSHLSIKEISNVARSLVLWVCGFYTPNLAGSELFFLFQSHCTPRYPCWHLPSLCANPPVPPTTLLQFWKKVQSTWLSNKGWNSLQHGENFTQNINSAHRWMKLHNISGILCYPKSARYKGLKINIYVGNEELFISSIFNEFYVSCRWHLLKSLTFQCPRHVTEFSFCGTRNCG